MNEIVNINAFDAIKMEIPNIPTVMTRQDWEKEYEAEFRKECKEKLRKYFICEFKKAIQKIKNAMEIIIKMAISVTIFYGIMSIITILVEWICTNVWI